MSLSLCVRWKVTSTKGFQLNRTINIKFNNTSLFPILIFIFCLFEKDEALGCRFREQQRAKQKPILQMLFEVLSILIRIFLCIPTIRVYSHRGELLFEIRNCYRSQLCGDANCGYVRGISQIRMQMEYSYFRKERKYFDAKYLYYTLSTLAITGNWYILESTLVVSNFQYDFRGLWIIHVRGLCSGSKLTCTIRMVEFGRRDLLSRYWSWRITFRGI